MNLPPRLNTLIDDEITLEDFPDDDGCPTCYGEGCSECWAYERALCDYYKEVAAERAYDESR